MIYSLVHDNRSISLATSWGRYMLPKNTFPNQENLFPFRMIPFLYQPITGRGTRTRISGVRGTHENWRMLWNTRAYKHFLHFGGPTSPQGYPDLNPFHFIIRFLAEVHEKGFPSRKVFFLPALSFIFPRYKNEYKFDFDTACNSRPCTIEIIFPRINIRFAKINIRLVNIRPP